MSRIIAAIITATALGFACAANAQQPAPAQQPLNIKRTPLQKVDVPGTNLDAITGIAEIVPNALI